MSIWQLLSSFPTSVPTVLLAVLMIYWLLSIVGLADMGDTVHLHTDIHAVDGMDAAHGGHDVVELHTLAGYLVALGLGGVPLSVVASVLVFVTWLATALLHRYVVVLVPTDLLRMLAGAGVLLFTAALSVPIAACVVRPMRGLFVKHEARSNGSLVGMNCKIITETVDTKFGRAMLDNHGTSLNIRVWAAVPNTLRKNARAVVVAYDETSGQFEVQAAPDTL